MFYKSSFDYDKAGFGEGSLKERMAIAMEEKLDMAIYEKQEELSRLQEEFEAILENDVEWIKRTALA